MLLEMPLNMLSIAKCYKVIDQFESKGNGYGVGIYEKKLCFLKSYSFTEKKPSPLINKADFSNKNIYFACCLNKYIALAKKKYSYGLTFPICNVLFYESHTDCTCTVKLTVFAELGNAYPIL